MSSLHAAARGLSVTLGNSKLVASQVLPRRSASLWSSVLLAVATLFVALFGFASLVGCGRSETDLPIDTADVGPDAPCTGDCVDSGLPDSLPPDVRPDGGPISLTSISLEPAALTVPVGSRAPVVARAFYSDGSRADVTSTATWTSSDPAVARVDAGSVLGVASGSARVRATIGAVFGEADVIVKGAAIKSLTIDPPFASIVVGGSVTFTATAFFVDGTSTDVSKSATWLVKGAPVGTVASGVVTATAAGSGVIEAQFLGQIADAKLDVAAGKTLSRVEVSPFSSTVGVGVTVDYKATAVYTDTTTSDVTLTATWTSSAPSVIDVVSGTPAAGQATSKSPGSAIISAAFGGATGSSPVTVSGASLTGLAVSPSAATIAVGSGATLVATATYSDGTSSDVSSSALWTTSDASIATVSSGSVTGIGVGSATITVSFGSMKATAAITVSAAKLLTITLSPADPVVPLGAKRAFKATGIYEGGATRDITADVSWSTDDPTIATVSNAPGSAGQITPVSVGKTTARATLSSVSGSTSLTVSAATIASIALTPSPLSMVQGTKQLETATATYTDGTVVDVTTTCTWASASSSIATVSNGAGSQGQVTAVGAGSSTISCTQSGVTGSASIVVSGPTLSSVSVTPIAPTCRVGDRIQFFATSISTGGTSSDVTFAALWSSDDATIVQYTGTPGRFRCLAAGKANVTATYSGKSSSTPVTVTDAVVTSVQIDPVDVTLAVGDVQQYQAIAIFSDGTSQNVTRFATFVSSAPGVASIATAGPATGRATALAAGTSTISGTYKGITGSTNLTVSKATVTSISISPAARSVPVGTRFPYSAQAIYSDGTSKDVTGAATWITSDAAVAQVSDAFGSKGAATALSAGAVTVSASYSGVTGTTSLTVTAATLVSVQVTPFSDSVAAGMPVQYRADAIYSDGTSGDVTALSTWLSSDSSVAAVSDAFGTKGRATTLKAGTVKITASYKGVVGSATLTVTGATLTTIQITPFKPTIPVGFGIGLTATGLYSDGTSADLTRLATWTSSDTSVVAVSDAGAAKGRLTPIGAGKATISASYGGVTGTDVVTVSSATLTSIAVTPNPATVGVSGSLPFNATGTFSDGSSLDVTNYVTWTSSDAAVADVSNAADSRGVASGFAAGSVTIKAQKSGVIGTATLTVK